MDSKTQLEDFKKTYQSMKKLGKEDRLTFLDSVVSYCIFLGFDYDKTMIWLALTRNVLPNIGQRFTECDHYDEIDQEYNKSLQERFFE